MLTTEDQLAITNLLHRYAHDVDRGRWEDFRSLFTSDCVLDLSQALGRYEGTAGIAKFVETMSALPIHMRHLVTNIVVSGDGTSAHAEAYVVAITGADPGHTQQSTGFYDDQLVKQEGRWLFRSRKLSLDVAKS